MIATLVDGGEEDLRGMAGTPLWGREQASLPCFGDLGLAGSEATQEWFAAVNARDRHFVATRAGYERYWSETSTAYRSKGTVAVAGGWGWIWSWEGEHLLLQTFDDAAPRYEAWLDEGRVSGFRRTA